MELTYYFVHIRNKNINSTSCSQEKKAYNHLYLKAPINKQGKDLTVWFSEYLLQVKIKFRLKFLNVGWFWISFVS